MQYKFILPDFENFDLNTSASEIKNIILENRKGILKLKDKIKNQSDYNFNEFIRELDILNANLDRAFSPIKHLNSVASNPEIRKVFSELEELIINYYLLIDQDVLLYKFYKDNVRLSREFDPAVGACLKLDIQSAELSGVALEKVDKDKFKALDTELSQLGIKFENNILDCTDAFSYFIPKDKVSELQGLMPHTVTQAQQDAALHKKDGYLFNLDAPTYISILTYADNRQLRQNFYEAYFTRASSGTTWHDAKFDNSKNIFDILTKRLTEAQLLGFKNYAEYSLAPKMAKSVARVKDFLWELADKARPFAEKELEHLKKFAKNQFGITELEPWDIAYYSEKLKQELFNISDAQLRKYFPLKKVLDGLFSILHKIYGVNIAVKSDVPVWNPQVLFLELLTSKNNPKGGIYLDLFARKQKRAGAWMDECTSSMLDADDKTVLPVAYVTCNFTPPENGTIFEAELTHDEVLTLFHEMGHALHHVLTEINVRSVSGINGVAWDVVELPSQIHENWCYDEASLQLLSEHIHTNEPLPKELLQQLKKSQNFQAGLFLLRQLEFALYDIIIHEKFDPEKGFEQVYEVLNEVRSKIRVTPIYNNDRMLNSFSHIFAGGYAAGYYSYLWAEMLSLDAFSKFKEEGVLSSKVGNKFLESILSKGGSVEPSVMFEEFRGRAPDINYLLEGYGLT